MSTVRAIQIAQIVLLEEHLYGGKPVLASSLTDADLREMIGVLMEKLAEKAKEDAIPPKLSLPTPTFPAIAFKHAITIRRTV